LPINAACVEHEVSRTAFLLYSFCRLNTIIAYGAFTEAMFVGKRQKLSASYFLIPPLLPL